MDLPLTVTVLMITAPLPPAIRRGAEQLGPNTRKKEKENPKKLDD
jgi:hypothetical protein